MSAATKTRMLRSKSKGEPAISALAEAAPMRAANGAISPAERQGRARADDADPGPEQAALELGRDVDRRAPQGHDRLLAAAPLGPVHVPLVREAEPLVDAAADRAQPGPLLQQLVPLAPVLERVGDPWRRTLQRGEGLARRGSAAPASRTRTTGRSARSVPARRPKNWPEASSASATFWRKLGVAALLHDPAPRPRVVEVLERPLDPEAAERQAEVLLGDLGDGVRLVEDDEVAREIGRPRRPGPAPSARAPPALMSEKRSAWLTTMTWAERTPRPRPLVEAAVAVAVAPGA
jgi:hypothetical protein